MSGESGAPTEPSAPIPAPDLKALGDKLVGGWRISGESDRRSIVPSSLRTIRESRA